MTAPLHAAAATTEDGWILLRAGAAWLLLPRADVRAIRHGGEADGMARLALSGQLQPLAGVRPGRYVDTVFEAADEGSAPLAWCWDEARLLQALPAVPQPLPPVLRAPGSPVDAWLEIDGQVAFLCDAQRLRRHALGR